MAYYIAAYKTGTYPTITKDRVFLWSRLYPAAATSPDPVARPANWQWVSYVFTSYLPIVTYFIRRRETTYGLSCS